MGNSLRKRYFRAPIVSLMAVLTTLIMLTGITRGADTAGKTRYQEMSLEELMNVSVVSVSKYNQPITQAPATIVVVTNQQIREKGYFDLSDLLRDLPGIDVVDNARGFGEFYTIRGIEGNDRFLVLYDGQRVNPVSGTFLSVGNSLSIRFAQRVEIVFGPASAVYGSDAFAGIINIISGESPQDSVMSAYADYGNLNTLDAGVEIRRTLTSDLAFSLMARIFRSDGPDFIGKDAVYNPIDQYPPPLTSKFEQPLNDHNICLKARYKQLSLLWYRQQFDEGNAFAQHPKSNIYNSENRWKLATNVLGVEYSREIAYAGHISAHIAYVNHVQDPETQFFKTRRAYSYDDTFNQYMTGKDNTIRGGVTLNCNTIRHLQLVSGVEYEHTKSVPPYANDQVLGYSTKYEGENAQLIDRVLTLTERRYGGFCQVIHMPVEILDLIAGLRYDYSSRYGGTLNPRVGFIARPFENATIKALYGTAFQAPSLFLQYEQWGAVTAVMLSVAELQNTEPGWELKNQNIETYEVSIDYQPGDNLRLNISPYYHHLSDLIERVIYTDSAYNKYFSDEDTTVYSLGFRNENVGVQKITGVNVSAYARIGSSIDGYMHYSYTDAVAERAEGNTAIPRIAKNKLWLGLTYRNLFDHITFSPRLKWVGEINNRNAAVFPNGRQPGYSTLDVSLSVSNLVDQITFFARFENILNRDIEHGGLYDQVIYLPTAHQPGISARFGIEVDL